MTDDRHSREAAAASRQAYRPTGPQQGVIDLLKACSDIVLIVDDRGVVRDLAFEDDDLAREVGSAWLDQPLVETVTVESRGKIQRMLAAATGDVMRQEINHVLGDEDLPVRYAAVRLAPEGPVAVLGRDLRDIARLQQQLVDATLAVERDYALHRATEIQFRVLFQHSADAVVIADAASRRIVDANPRAEDLLRRTSRQLVGTDVEKLFAEASARDVQNGFAAARAVGQAAWPGIALRHGPGQVDVGGWLIRSSVQPQILLRLSTTGTGPAPVDPAAPWGALRNLPEPLVATDAAMRITDANVSFLDLVGAPSLESLRGEPMARYLGRHDLDVVRLRLEDGGAVWRHPVSVRSLHGSTIRGDLSGAERRGGPAASRCFLFSPRPEPPASDGGRAVIKAPQEMTGLVGRMPLREIVRETADIIEELCIEAALDLTNDNRASAAEMLGLSRQSLYAKLRRHGLGNLPGDDRDDP